MATTATSSQTKRSRFLDLAALSAFRSKRFVARHRIEGAYTGRHRSKTQGPAGEFVDYREYVEGEDLRRLDWKVLGRTGRAYTRLFQDETNLLCTMLIDASSSMTFAGHRKSSLSKLEYSQYFTTALSQLILHQQDQVGVAVASTSLTDYFPPAGTASHVIRLQHAIETIQPQPQTNLATALQELFARAKRRSVVLILSDFLVDNLDEVFAGLRLFRHRRWPVIALHLIDPDEERFPKGLAYRFEGLENDGRADASPDQIRAAYEERFAAHCAAVRNLSLTIGCDYHRISTAIPYLQTLATFLQERSA